MPFDRDTAEVYANGATHVEEGFVRVLARTYQLKSPLIAIATLVCTASFFITWHAGHESAGLDDQQLKAEINRLSQELSATQLELGRQRQRGDQFEKQLTADGRANSVKQQDSLRQQLLKAQAEAEGLRQVLQREEDPANQGDRLSSLLAEPGVRMIPMQASEAAAGSVAYALVIENEKLVFVASNLPLPATGKVWQLWLLRNQSPIVVNAGVVHPGQFKNIWIGFDDGAVISDLSELEVTEEPEGGSSQPTGPKIFDATLPGQDSPWSRHFSEGDLLTGSLLRFPHPDTSR